MLDQVHQSPGPACKSGCSHIMVVLVDKNKAEHHLTPEVSECSSQGAVLVCCGSAQLHADFTVPHTLVSWLCPTPLQIQGTLVSSRSQQKVGSAVASKIGLKACAWEGKTKRNPICPTAPFSQGYIATGHSF